MDLKLKKSVGEIEKKIIKKMGFERSVYLKLYKAITIREIERNCEKKDGV